MAGRAGIWVSDTYLLAIDLFNFQFSRRRHQSENLIIIKLFGILWAQPQ